jgi:Ca-activated chloride channel family protein
MLRASPFVLVTAMAWALVSSAGRWPVLTAAQRPAFRAGVDLVSLSVTATDAHQRYVSNLTRDDFVVLEDGVQQNLTFFARTGIPLALALLIDTSASMEDTLATAQEAAIGFTRQLGHEDLATVIDFDSRVQVAQDFTSDLKALETAIQQTAAGGSTSLYNAVYIALRELNKLIPRHDNEVRRRRAVVVLSDGEDTSSLVTFDEVLDLASRSDTMIYAIGLGVQQSPGPRAATHEGAFVLRRLTQQTGGRAFFPQQARELADVYGQIRSELASQYSLAYESTGGSRHGQWRRITVRVNRPGVTVRTRQGYFAPSK